MSFIPYGRQSISEEDIKAVVDVLRSDWLTTGPVVEAFETDLSAVLRTPTVVVSSGTAALHAAYYAAGLGPGDEIVTTPLTFVATAAAAIHLGAEVRFADVQADTLNLDPTAVKHAMTDQTRAVVPVDFAGHPADLGDLQAVARDAGAMLIEDASHAIGARYDDRPVGSIADLTTFSFHPVKTITTGEGGAVSALDPTLLETVKRFRNHGLVRNAVEFVLEEEGAWHQEVQKTGLNYRMPDILAALGRSQLQRLSGFIDTRQTLAEHYHETLEDVDGIRLPHRRRNVQPAWHLFTIRVLEGRRKALFDDLRGQGIGVQVHYLPVHLQPAFLEMGFRRGMYPIAESAYEELLSLPLYPGLAKDQQDRVISAVRGHFGC